MEMTKERWEFTNNYLRDVFGAPDEQLKTLMPRAIAAGIPDIAVSADVGRLLKILASMTNGGRGARRIVEVGTLAGYSGIWLARGLESDSKARLLTIEPNPLHADFAEREFRAAGLGGRVEMIRGEGLPVLARLVKDLGPGSVDVLFLDAIKTEYPEYLRIGKPLIARGGLLIADNVLGSGGWWIDTPPGGNENRDAADRFNRLVCADRDFEAVAVPLREGVLIARRIG
jgi:predicted O-methyltransferase YrrM